MACENCLMPQKKNNRVQEFFSVRFRRLLSGAPDGIPPWLEVVAAGDEPGLFLPSDAPWIVHGDFATLVGGIRALLMQALHPGTLAGVADHSRYKSDPLGRLSGTIRWLTVTTFGSKAAIAAEANRVNRLHTRVTGDYKTASGQSKAYKAADEDLLLWVHIAFADSFLTCHENYSLVALPANGFASGADNYVAKWSASVAPLGLSKVPMSRAELDHQIRKYYEDGLLTVNERTLEVIEFLKNPPLPSIARIFYRLFFAAAVATIPDEFRKLLGLKQKSSRLIKPVTTATLRFMRFAIGPESPIEQAALDRLARIGAI